MLVLLSILACTADSTGSTATTDTATTDTGADPGETASETGETADTADTGTGQDTSETGDTGTPVIEDDGWPTPFFAPYVDATAYPTVKVGEIPTENGVNRYTLGFLVATDASTCTASWGTYYSLETGPSAWDGGAEYFLYDQVATLRSLGGDVMVSFGGAANTPIDAACTTVPALVAEYQRVITALDLTRIDLDIEGSWAADAPSIARRSAALAELQAWAAAEGRPLHVWYTLPVLPSGLTAEGLDVVRSAADAGVNLDGVNLMTMDYGAGAAPNPDGLMGEYGIDCVNAVLAQLATIWPSATEAELSAKLGSTPMIGQNDVAGERFDLDDAAQTRAQAEAGGWGRLSMWSTNRDHPCPEATDWAESTCSGYTDVADWAFSAVFAGFGE